jgi:predicted ABC-type ATPase
VPAQVYVLAGVNGAGKSSIGAAALAVHGVPSFDPDLAARALRDANPGLDIEAANGHAWAIGRAGLERALHEGAHYAFETTLGARTIPDLLQAGAERGAAVHVWYAGLASPELHLQRVRERVAAGGHDIPEAKIRERYVASRANLIRLLPVLASLRLFDNSAEGDPKQGRAPRPLPLLHMEGGRIVSHIAIEQVPQWAKPIFAAAFELAKKSRPTRGRK